ncbi:winged helix DNA-binding domain-containing protein [Mycobacterium paraterrae]|uniref:Winged helix DNA-binding domain-containing protein n=1 Tax=Mycobacterium paraterrae TaxID=577492 RepID=A0ABY3VQQ9_9MYCO|nr:winged helix DNA-binding domain-containing protein [Mycobacterium paraterrae]UMB71793.1 winged helix DNA-binding domain-containing protein [Mycobacterium paraterrae]
MRHFTAEERRRRLVERQFVSLADRVIPDATAELIGLHATDPATPFLSLWARCPGFVASDLERELYENRTVARHLAMRRTLWVVAASDLPVIQAAASDRVAANEHRRLVGDLQKAGITTDGEGWLTKACSAVLDHLAEHGPLTSTELRSALPEIGGTYDPAPGKSWGGHVPVAPRVLTVLSARGAIVRGPNDGGWTTSRPRWASTAEWLALATAPLEPFSALLQRWLRTFGPATAEDVKWWFGTTLTATRKALGAIGAVEVDVGSGPGFALAEDLDDESDPEPVAALLPGLDVTTMGWFERDWYLNGHRGQVFDRNGNAGPTAWWNGRVVGGWYQDDGAQVHVQLLEDPGRDGRRALTRRAAELTSWLDGVRIKPRFPSPLSKAAD